MKSSECLVIEDVHKRLGAVRALAGVSFEVRSGSVHGIIGHNGSGKSTLVKVLSGVLTADQGSFNVVAARDRDPSEGRRPRVATVFQDLGLADQLTVYENILVNSFKRGKLGFISERKERARLQEALTTLGFDLPFGVEAWRLPEAERVMACIARALFRGEIALSGAEFGVGDRRAGADVLLLDEPTASLPREELERFRALIKRLKDEAGVTILIVTHHPSDVGVMCDEFTALKGGQVLCTLPASGVSFSGLAELMAGKAIDVEQNEAVAARSSLTRSTAGAPGSASFETIEVMVEGLTAPVSLRADQGEVVGLTGLEGSGFREFVAGAAGVRELLSGQVYVAGKQMGQGPDALRKAKGIYIPADRARTSGVPDATIYENMTLGIVGDYCRGGVIRARRERRDVARILSQLDVSPPDPQRKLSELSGGQQQKVVVGRALLATGAKAVLFEEPTAGVDVGAREDILRYIRELAARGTLVFLATAEFEWLPAACDRIVVFRSGTVAGELRDKEMGEEAILRLAYGGA